MTLTKLKEIFRKQKTKHTLLFAMILPLFTTACYLGNPWLFYAAMGYAITVVYYLDRVYG